MLSYSICCLNLLYTENTAKGANLLRPLDVRRLESLQLQGGFAPDPLPGALPQTSVIGSRSRACHVPPPQTKFLGWPDL